MQALHLLALDPVAETTADENSYGFRQKRRCADAVDGCAIALRRRGSSPWILEGDIRGCFDNISHDWLLAHVLMDRAILRKWLKAGYMEKQVLHATEEGTPQGGIISPVLANLALDGLDRRLRERYPLRGKGSDRGRKAGVHLIRYADDFIITGKTKELLNEEVRPLVESFLLERGLELSAEKTKITHIEEGFDFLGQNVRRYSHGKLWVKPSKKNIHTFLEKVRSLVKKSLHAPAWRLATELNRMIRGWALYHRHVKSTRIFSSVDRAIFIALWRWALRWHPRKGKRWLMRRYFARRGGRSWCFFGSRRKPDGSKMVVWLFHATSLPFSIYTKVKRASNPYHPAWEMYSRSEKANIWPAPLRVVLYCFTYGGRRAANALHAVSRSLGRQDGIAITSSQRSSAGTTAQPTASFCTQSVIVNCTANSAVSTAASRKRRLEGLSRVSWKLSRTVLRGAVGGNADCLLDNKFAIPPKQPYTFELSSGGTFAFAGLWDAWKDREGHWLQSFAIVTTEANELMAPIHPRMPVILHARDYDRWLDREETERLPLDLLRPFESEAMEMYEANLKVGNIRNNGPEMMRAALKAAEDGALPL